MGKILLSSREEIKKIEDSANTKKDNLWLEINKLFYKQNEPINDAWMFPRVVDRVQEIRIELEKLEIKIINEKNFHSNISVISETFFERVLKENCRTFFNENKPLNTKHRVLTHLLTALKSSNPTAKKTKVENAILEELQTQLAIQDPPPQIPFWNWEE